MKLNKRSILAVTISLLLAACGSDTKPTVPVPDRPEPLVPAPAEPFDAQIGNVTIKATKEELVITSNTENDKLAYIESFKGIKYAEAQRFEHSNMLPLSDNTDEFEVIDATQFGYACPQLKTTSQTQDENCLNLNIWRPAGVDSDADLPVYVFIHGGDFEYGSSSEALVHGDTVVAQGSDDGKPFIYVSLNYRLGQLGTQWVEGEDEDGNYGLGDQKRALEWVHNNIADFGGNAQNVTVMGQGSGAMSIGFLQQDEDIAGQYFQRAIMQSNPYGFEYPSYDVAKDRNNDFDANTSIDEIMASQETALNGIEQLKNWLLSSLSVSVSYLGQELEVGPKSGKTPMPTLMPFAPYLGCESLATSDESETICIEPSKSPLNSDFSVQTILGNNAHEANSFGILFSVTFLIPTIIDEFLSTEAIKGKRSEAIALDALKWLDDEHNQDRLLARINNMSSKDVAANAGLSLTAYTAVTELFWGMDSTVDIGVLTPICLAKDDPIEVIECIAKNVDIELNGHEQTNKVLNLTDFYPNSESSLGGALDNMKQFKTLLNDTLFNGPARHMAANSGVEATLYHFEHKPSFNMWNYNTLPNGELSIIDLFKTIGCVSGACNGSELPFVFNKAVRFDGSEVRPSSKDKALMNEMSRLWFSDELFEGQQYSDATDNVLVIDGTGFSENSTTLDWDYVTNPGVDPKLRKGRLTGLAEEGLMPWQWYLN
ncbi:Para-nitrobenzyl esterase [Vibrio crassostreae]|nr:Para-nitrobenzyl esterase [Vibrio crassostreae]CAK1790425.1 Para-nitrobenzyl esterase [Vibrio crassostreae]CAK1841327.1 Para-nitrobenzyl esterase [Vibrio crassostreae]CAK2272932.1 Para-nitrobenzyl esterase [Vibrio crassostreae]CAK2643110.1 Para-nitrobenzyl esterase [Vibrio crassostreae]